VPAGVVVPAFSFSVAVVALLSIVLLGLNWADAPEGRLLAASETEPVNPLRRVTVSV
jgi:hypothetical protein